ncbi:MAG: hypothetical protein ABSA05_00765, partial [Opitutaceae bacterium]
MNSPYFRSIRFLFLAAALVTVIFSQSLFGQTLYDLSGPAGYIGFDASGINVGGHPKPAIDGHVKTGHEEDDERPQRDRTRNSIGLVAARL